MLGKQHHVPSVRVVDASLFAYARVRRLFDLAGSINDSDMVLLPDPDSAGWLPLPPIDLI